MASSTSTSGHSREISWEECTFFLPPRPFSIVFPSSTRNSFLGRRPAALQFSTDARDRSFFSSLLLSDGSANSSRRIFLSQNLWKIDRWWNRRMRFPRRRILILKKGIRKVRWWNRESEIKERRKFFTRSSSKEFSLFKLCWYGSEFFHCLNEISFSRRCEESITISKLWEIILPTMLIIADVFIVEIRGR